MIRHVAVLIPACDEEARIDECLRAVIAARARCPTDVSITVVADKCTDDTALIARGFPGVDVLEIDAGNVGIARRAAADHALGGLGIPAASVLLANTDADSIVPKGWLVSQIRHLDGGYDVVIGTVRPDPREYPAERQAEWERTHIKGQPNGHVHGANLGVRASAYLDVGGYRPLPEHEDVDLVGRLKGFRQVASDEAEVITSARLDGRAPGGYAGYLRRQLEDPPPSEYVGTGA